MDLRSSLRSLFCLNQVFFHNYLRLATPLILTNFPVPVKGKHSHKRDATTTMSQDVFVNYCFQTILEINCIFPQKLITKNAEKKMGHFIILIFTFYKFPIKYLKVCNTAATDVENIQSCVSLLLMGTFQEGGAQKRDESA